MDSSSLSRPSSGLFAKSFHPQPIAATESTSSHSDEEIDDPSFSMRCRRLEDFGCYRLCDIFFPVSFVRKASLHGGLLQVCVHIAIYSRVS